MCQVDPFAYFKIAEVCMAIYKYQFMPVNTIGVRVNTGEENQYKLAIKWLNSFNNTNIHYLSNGCECKIAQYKVDFYDKNTQTIYNYYNYYWDKCPQCYNRN